MNDQTTAREILNTERTELIAIMEANGWTWGCQKDVLEVTGGQIFVEVAIIEETPVYTASFVDGEYMFTTESYGAIIRHIAYLLETLAEFAGVYNVA